MKKYVFLAVMSAAIIYAYGAATTSVNRLSRGIQSTVGTTDYNGTTLVVSDNPTNEFRMHVETVTFSAGSTTKTNTYATAYLASPTIFLAQVDGYSLSGGDKDLGPNIYSTTTTHQTYSKLTLTRPSTSTGTADVYKFLINGYTRTGSFD